MIVRVASGKGGTGKTTVALMLAPSPRAAISTKAISAGACGQT